MVIVMLTCLLLFPSAAAAIHQRISTAPMSGTFCTGNGLILEAYTKSSPWILSGEVIWRALQWEGLRAALVAS